jgi:hypothetical protein
MCGGSDWPVSSPDPILAIHVAVNRALPAEAGGCGGDAFISDQSIELASMLAAYTSGSAAVNGVADHQGSIRPGMDADFAVIDADLAHVAAGDIWQAKVSQTWVRGDLGYAADAGAA